MGDACGHRLHGIAGSARFLSGEPLELLTGYLFGAGGGLIVCLLGMLIGSLVIFFLVRTFGAIDCANTLLAQQQSVFPLFTVIPMLYLFSTLLLLFTAIYGFVRHRLR